MANRYTKSMRDALQEARDYRDPEELTEKLKAGRGKVSVIVKSEPPDDFRGDEKAYSKAMKKLYKITIKSNPRTGISQVSGEKSDILKYLQSHDYGIHDPDIEKFWPELLESHIEEGKGFLEYDEWLKKVKGIKKGAHGINSDEHAKYSEEWRAYVKGLFGKLPPIKKESNLKEIVGGHGDMTITKDGGVMIIKTKDWQTYKAKGWVKREEVENESLDLSATGAITSNSTGQEDESEELTEGRTMIAVDKNTKKKWQFSGGMIVKYGMKNAKEYDTEGVTMQQVLELSSRQGFGEDIKLSKKDVEDGFARGTFSVIDDGRVWQPWKNDFEPEGEQELTEVHWSNKNEPPAPKGMHKLRSGRDVPSTPQVDKIHNKVAAMTDRNDHFGATIQLANEVGDKDLVQIYKSLELMHRKYGVVGNKSIELRQIFSPVLNNQLDRKFGKYADVLRDAL